MKYQVEHNKEDDGSMNIIIGPGSGGQFLIEKPRK